MQQRLQLNLGRPRNACASSRQPLALTESDQADLHSRDYTLLDGQYLETCLLFLDGSRILIAGPEDLRQIDNLKAATERPG